MNKLILLVGVLICLVAVNARHYRSADETDDEDSSKPKEHISGHRRKRWQASYGYDYPPPTYYYPDRRDDRNTQETLQNIYRLLEDISSYLRRTPPPPPPPQPIYIPYPIAYPPRVACKPQNSTMKDPNPDRRNLFTDTMDQNRNWGLLTPADDDISEDENDGARPISFEPLVPRKSLRRPVPQVEHGSQQASFSTDAPKFLAASPLTAAFAAPSAQSKANVPGMCTAAILSCCGFSSDATKQRQCFSNVGCAISFAAGSACTPDSIQRALDSFQEAYSPVQ